MSDRRVPFKFRLDIFLLSLYLFVSGLLLAFSSGGFIVNFGNIGFSVLSGAQRGLYSVASFFSGTINAVHELTVMRKSYIELQERIADYELLQRSNAEIRLENEHLKKLLGFSRSLDVVNIPAEITGRDPSNLYSGLIINRGSRHGIRKNMPVVSFQGSGAALVGKIVQVGRSSSIILPVYDYQAFVSARLQSTRYEGLINGQGGVDVPLVMKYIKKRARDEISVGDIVVTSGESYQYPKNVPVGMISRIRGLDYETSLELDIEPIIDFSRLEDVFVLDMSSLKSEIE
ncbi:rod shape-determining protein MreC [Treponema zuelzerae]|uniref:Cell shape-determining protein MreC n=1 Tax=Teretinema zuelzerae TaxID=156 RepID=A0AAE3EJH7_9SPIR|nr:rod shape-determining protein MreC [Teretinema zuelzerae]MCD1654593.1 rod shape-determining protein MreC [Teretinema zuelzerae]